MIAILLVALFVLAATAALTSLADSAVRANNSVAVLWYDKEQLAADLSAPAIRFSRLRPACTAHQPRLVSRPAPQLPRAVAA